MKRSTALEDERARQQKMLNASFADFTSKSLTAEPCAKWADAAIDYVLYAQALERFTPGEWQLYTWVRLCTPRLP